MCVVFEQADGVYLSSSGVNMPQAFLPLIEIEVVLFLVVRMAMVYHAGHLQFE